MASASAGLIAFAGLTARQLLVEHVSPTPGQKIVVHAGSCGVGMMAIQLARHRVAPVVMLRNLRLHIMLRP